MEMKVSRMTRCRSESISSSSTSSLSSASNSVSASLHQAKSLESLDRDDSSTSSSSTDQPQQTWTRRKDDVHPNRSHHHQSTISSCESSGSSCCWSRNDDGQSSSSAQSATGSSSYRSGRHYPDQDRRRLLHSHPKHHEEKAGVDSVMLTIFRCCLDRRQRPSAISSRWTESPEYGHLDSCSSSAASLSCRSSIEGLNEKSHHGAHTIGLTATLINKVPNQRYSHYYKPTKLHKNLPPLW